MGIPYINLDFAALWYKGDLMPSQIPKLPPTIAIKNKEFSDILCFLSIAAFLSYHIIRYDTTLTTKKKYKKISGIYPKILRQYKIATQTKI